MKMNSEELYEEWRELYYKNIDDAFLSEEIVDWCDDQFDEWLGTFSDEDPKPAPSQIVKFAWSINRELAEMEMNALLRI
jgi:hypothetical protein